MPITWTRFLPPDLPSERVAACFGLISDTHMPERCASLPPEIFDVLRDVDLLLHAGDVGELWVLDRLSAIAPVVAVHGNDETADAQRELPYQQIIAVDSVRIVLTHAHYPDRAEELRNRRDDAWTPKLERRAAFGRRAGARIVVFGHTHIPMAYDHGGVLLVNPGAIASGGYTTRQRLRTVGLLFVRDDGLPFVSHIDLSAPDQRFVPQIDWSAGFQVALDGVSEPILDSELAAIWPRLQAMAQEAREHSRDALLLATRNALLRAARPCWSGERDLLTFADLLAELRREPDLPPSFLRDVENLHRPHLSDP